MFKFFKHRQTDQLWDFSGGIHPAAMKQQTCHIPLRRLPLSPYFVVPLKQHLGPAGDIQVNIGDHVLKGQALTRGTGRSLPVHAPTSGIITKIGPASVAHPSGLSEICIEIQADGEDRWIAHQGLINYQKLSAQALIDYLCQAGIAGLGGAGFPTSAKLSSGLSQIEVLLINGAECEPYITADDRLMQEHAHDILQGCAILQHILQPKLTIIGIEDNKPESIAKMTDALKEYTNILLRVIPTKYPSGGAKQLTKILTGREIPHNHHSADIGVLMHNVATAYAIQRAIIHGEPLIERVVTLTGDAIEQKGNVWLPLGTPVSHVLTHCHYTPEKQSKYGEPMVIMGGPLMGFTLPHHHVPVVKITNCILAPTVEEIPPLAKEQACIRCGLCADACPAGLLPQQLYWFSKGKEHHKAQQYHLTDCIECGACAFVCPSNIPLVHYYRQEKAELFAIKQDALRSQQAKQRFEAKKIRMEQQHKVLQQKHKQAAARMTTNDKDTIQAALNRVKSLKTINDMDNSSYIYQKNQPNTPDSNMLTAIAAVKINHAKTEQHPQNDVTPPQVTTQTNDVSIRQKMLAEAIARAKAKKMAQQATIDEAIPSSTTAAILPPPSAPPQATEQQKRKQMVAEAIARAKARKASQQHITDDED